MFLYLIDFSRGAGFDNVRLETLTHLLGEGLSVFHVLQDGLGFVHDVIEVKQLLFEGQEGVGPVHKVGKLSAQPRLLDKRYHRLQYSTMMIC